jgi:Zn-dependent protease with chaperone function
MLNIISIKENKMWDAIKALALYMPRQIILAFNYNKEVGKLAQKIQSLKADVSDIDDADYCAVKSSLTEYFNTISDKLPEDVSVDLICHRNREADEVDQVTMKPRFNGVCTPSAQVLPVGHKSYAVIFNTDGFRSHSEQTHQAVFAHELSHVKNNDPAYLKKSMRQKALLNMGVILSAGAIATGVSPLILGGLVATRLAHSFIDKSVMRRAEFAADKGMVEYFNAPAEGLGSYLNEEGQNVIHEAKDAGEAGFGIKLLAALLTHPSHNERLKALGLNR